MKLVILELNRPMIDSYDHFYQFDIEDFSKKSVIVGHYDSDFSGRPFLLSRFLYSNI